MDPKLYSELNKAWKSTCRVLFGEEIGELKDYEEWLKRYLPVSKKMKSHLSGKEVAMPLDYYCDKAKFISADELKELAVPLNINEIKDIDSIIEAVSERWEYTGNMVIGKLTAIESSTLVTDSSYVANSVDVNGSSHILYSSMVYDSKHLFGCHLSSKSEFCIGCYNSTILNRCLEVDASAQCADSYFCHYCKGIKEGMFCFNVGAKRYAIGNVELAPDAYRKLKGKLLKEIADELKRDKEFKPDVFNIGCYKKE